MKITAQGRQIAISPGSNSALLQQLRNIPGKKKWQGGYLLVEPTVAAVDFIQAAFPHAVWDDESHRHIETIAKIRACAIPPPVVETTDYIYKTKPYDHQKRFFLGSRDANAWAFFMEQGTGKTKVIIDTVAYLWAKGLIRGLLVIAYPNGVHGNWVNKEIPEHMPDWVKCYAFAWIGDGRVATCDKAKFPIEAIYTTEESALHVLTINVEALSTKRGEEICRQFLTVYPSMAVIDESTSIKTPSTKRTKAIIRLGAYAPFRRIMTGTPVTSGPLNLYSQFLFLDEEIIGFGSYYSYRSRYAVMRALPGKVSKGGRPIEVVVGYQHEGELQDKVKNYSYRILKKDCLDLPPKIYLPPIRVNLTDEQRYLYNEFAKNAVAEFRGRQVTAAMAITKMLRCHQVVCGFMPPESNDPDVMGEPLESGNPRLEEQLKQLELVLPYDDARKEFDASQKVLIWAHYRYNIKQLLEAIEERYGPGVAKPMSRLTPMHLRPLLVEEYQNPKSRLKILVGNKAMAYGWTLTEAGHCYYYSNVLDLEVRSQSEDRPHRIGLTHSVNYTDFIAPGTVDIKFLSILRGHYEVASTILGDELTDWLLPKSPDTLFE